MAVLVVVVYARVGGLRRVRFKGELFNLVIQLCLGWYLRDLCFSSSGGRWRETKGEENE